MLSTAVFLIISFLSFALLVAAEEKKEKEFPLVWLCLGISVPGAIAVLYAGYRRPETLQLEGMTVMQAVERDLCDPMGEKSDPVGVEIRD
ncbi:hypothetical protein AGDE_11696 [Angomonas deanei]|nr:hypothetical protein AGDE_11696 [Angomonas deanei]|eukprot:EPY25790.1 hypothetical protein AGDE_11696 [Angomonas deanei]